MSRLLVQEVMLERQNLTLRAMDAHEELECAHADAAQLRWQVISEAW